MNLCIEVQALELESFTSKPASYSDPFGLKAAESSPTFAFRGKEKLQAFTAISIAKDSQPYQFDMGERFCPFRRDVKWLRAHVVAIIKNKGILIAYEPEAAIALLARLQASFASGEALAVSITAVQEAHPRSTYSPLTLRGAKRPRGTTPGSPDRRPTISFSRRPADGGTVGWKRWLGVDHRHAVGSRPSESFHTLASVTRPLSTFN